MDTVGPNMHKLSQIDRSEVALGGNMRLGLTCIINNLLWPSLVVVLVIHVRYGVLDNERYVKNKMNPKGTITHAPDTHFPKLSFSA